MPVVRQKEHAPASNTRGVVQIEGADKVGDAAGGRALREVGDEVAEFGVRLKAATDDREAATASRLTREKLDKLKFDMETSRDTPNPMLPDHWRQESDRIVEEGAKTISSPRLRGLWLEKTGKVWQAEGDIWSRVLGRKRDVDDVVASHVTTEADLKTKIGDPTLTRDSYMELTKAERSVITRNAQRGFIDKEQAGRMIAQLDAFDKADHLSRTSAAIRDLVAGGQSKEADALIKQAGATLQEQESLTKIKEGAEADLREAQARAKREQREAEIIETSKTEIDIWDGKVNDAMIRRGAADGRYSINDVPGLQANLRAYQNAMKVRDGLDEQSKARWADWSQDTALYLQYNMDPATYQAGPEAWPEKERGWFQQMDPDRQRGVRADIYKAREETAKGRALGRTANAGQAVYSDAIAVAKRLAPDWKLGTQAITEDGRGFETLLARRSQIYAEENSGKPIPAPAVRELVARALTSYKPEDFVLPPDLQAKALGEQDLGKGAMGLVGKAGLDMERVRDLTLFWKREYGRDPTPAELAKLYDKKAK